MRASRWKWLFKKAPVRLCLFKKAPVRLRLFKQIIANGPDMVQVVAMAVATDRGITKFLVIVWMVV